MFEEGKKSADVFFYVLRGRYQRKMVKLVELVSVNARKAISFFWGFICCYHKLSKHKLFIKESSAQQTQQ